MIIQNVKGGYDYLPEEQALRNKINTILKETFEQFGYQPIETPILCYYEMLVDKYDEKNDLVKEIYQLKDQGKRNLGLRYDLTVPFAKFIALNKNKLMMPFKRYEIAKVFRDGPIKVGRDREFTQCDVDVVGLSGQTIEAELLLIFAQAFKKLEIDILIKYNNRNLMTGLILESGVGKSEVSKITTILDKIEKLTQQELIELLKNANLEIGQIEEILSNFNLTLEQMNTKYKTSTNELIKLGLEELNQLTKYIIQLNLETFCVFAPSLARGQNYYTGNVFEVYERSFKIKNSIGAGGRYDQMITQFINDGNLYPAVGISFGLSSIYELLKQKENKEKKAWIDIEIIPIETEIESLLLASYLRNLGFKVEIEMKNKKIKKSLEEANKKNIPYVILLGLNELTEKSFRLKDMRKNKDIEIKWEEIKKIKKYIF